jgi:sugar lactone lactonase YvrE
MRPVYLFWLALSASVVGQVVPPGPGFVSFAGIAQGVGDAGPAVLGTLGYPKALTWDAQGNLYIADFGSARVRKVTPGGTITTVAGTGVDGFSGDGGRATSAQLSSPTGVAVDSAGNLYIADGPNARIRRVSPSGIITTFAGNGDPLTLRPWQIAIDSKGNLYAADGAQTNVRKIDLSGAITLVAGNGQTGISGDGGPATAAMIVAVGVAVDGAGNVLIAGGGRIRRVTPDGTISTLADGTDGADKFDGGMLSVGAGGTIYMADNANERVVKFAADGTAMETVAGTGVYGFSEGCGTPGGSLKKIAKNAQLAQPEAVLVDRSGAVYITDSANQRIRKVTPDGLIATIAGPNPGFSGDGGPALAAGLSNPMGMAFDSTGAMYVADSQNNRVRKITTDGVIRTVAGDGGPTAVDDPACFAPNEAFLRMPSAVAVDKSGDVFIADTGNNRIRELAADGTAATIAGNGQAGYGGDGGPAAEAALNAPSSLAVDATGNLFISDSMNNVIREIAPDGIIRTLIPGLAGGLAVDAAGNFYYGGPLFAYRKTPGGNVDSSRDR